MPLEGQQLAHYHLVHRLRKGGMGEVYLANDEQLRRQVAIKVIRTDTSANDAQEAARLFLREARVIARFDHPNILPLYEAGEGIVNGIPIMYMVMPFRQEGSLSDWLRKCSKSRTLLARDVERLVKQAASALQHAHDYGIIHQDIKPPNFLIRGKAEQADELNLQLADFGVAKLMATTSESLTIRGTPLYMAPEQWEGYPSPATDQYALAVMTYELLTGRPPFIGSNLQQLCYQHCYVDPPPLYSINPRLHQDLDGVLLRALSKNPRQRFRSVSAFADAFAHVRRNSGNIIPLNPTEEAAPLTTFSNMSQTVRAPARDANNVVTFTPPQKRTSVARTILLLILAFSVIVAGVALSLYSIKNAQIATSNANTTAISGTYTASANTSVAVANNTTATAQRNATGTAQTQTNATATAITQAANAHATATAQIKASATTQALNANATATAQTLFYNNSIAIGSLVLNDPMAENSQGNNWDVAKITGGGTCAFIAGAYHVTAPQKGYLSPCFDQAPSFTNFSYEIQMTIIAGDQAGIAFRADPVKGNFYYFSINRDGDYALKIYTNYNPGQTLLQGMSPAIKTALNQSNLLAVKAIGNTFTFYINRQPIASVIDSTYAQGYIGVVAEDVTSPTEVTFSNAKVWTQK